MTPEQLLQHRELEFLRACGTGNRKRIIIRAQKLREARRLHRKWLAKKVSA